MKIATLVASLAVAWTAALAPVAAEDTPASLYEAAKKEGKISIWSSLETSLHQKQWEAFSKKYPGIQIEAFRIQPGPAIERAIAEARAGKQTVDIMDTNSGYLQLLFDRGMVKPYDWEKVFGIPRSSVLYESRVVQIGHYDLPIAYNTSLVKADELKSWDDLANPKWKGKLLLEARGFGLSILAQDWGIDKTVGYIKKLLDNKPIITKGASPTADGLAGGQGSVAVGALGARLSLFKQQGAPVDWARVGPMPHRSSRSSRWKARPIPMRRSSGPPGGRRPRRRRSSMTNRPMVCSAAQPPIRAARSLRSWASPSCSRLLMWSRGGAIWKWSRRRLTACSKGGPCDDRSQRWRRDRGAHHRRMVSRWVPWGAGRARAGALLARLYQRARPPRAPASEHRRCRLR